MDVVFSVLTVRRGAVGACLWEVECFDIQMFVSCVYPLNAAFCMTCSQFVNAGR